MIPSTNPCGRWQYGRLVFLLDLHAFSQPEGIEFSEYETGEALADSLEAQFQTATDSSEMSLVIVEDLLLKPC